jgi:ubiquinone biosynthesis protein
MKMGRLAEISRVFVEEGLSLPHPGATEEQRHEPQHLLPEDEREKAARLRRALERLGPTFVKFGQLLATRIDLFEPEFIAELSQLRAHVPSYPTLEARRILEEDLGRPIEDVFAEFPEEPVASASMAQVYRATLRATQEEVAVKVSRPALRETLERDLEVIIDLSRTLDHLLPAYHRSMVHRVAVEYAARARQEGDLLAEARAMQQFAEVTEAVREFQIPKVHLELCSARVIVMEWLPGRLLDDVSGPSELRDQGHEPRELVLSVLRLQLVMSYEFGFVHGDTHPGNLILLPDGRIGLIDFGLNGHVPRRLCDQMLELLFQQASGRRREAVHTFEQIFAADTDFDHRAFEEELGELLGAEPPQNAKNPLTGQLVAGLRLGARYRLRAQSELFLVLRNLTIVEGIVVAYFPEVDLLAEAKSILRGIMLRRARKGLGEAHFSDMIPMFLLNLSKRPQVIDSLLRLERSFSDSIDLGEFLEREGVFERQRRGQKRSLWGALLAGFAGALIAIVLLRLLGVLLVGLGG